MIRLGSTGWVALGLMSGGVGCSRPAPEPSPDNPSTQDRGAVHQDRRFSGFLRLATRGGSDSVRVELSNLDVRSDTTVDRLDLPFEGTLIAYIQAGTATVTIDGRRQEKNQGQIWTVPPGASFGLATGRDAVSLQTVLIEIR